MNFESRHIGPSTSESLHIARALGYASNEELLRAVVPAGILVNDQLDLRPAVSEHEVLDELRTIATENVVRRCAIGTGYYPTITPPVILRNVLENPAWYTAYTPYQPEISQGRLEALLNFQTVITEITGLDIANASLLDESTAIAEAVTMARRTAKNNSRIVAVHDDTHPQHLSVLRARCKPVGISVEVQPLDRLSSVDAFCVVVSRPSSSGLIADDETTRRVVESAHSGGAIAVCVTDPLASTILTTPASLGFDIAVGSAQRFGVPMGGGGPHAAYLAATEQFARSLPGRLVGVSTDTAGRPALRLALQTREQHIRREKATSNICTAQALLANIAGFYAAWHGRDGLQAIARRISGFTQASVALLRNARIGSIAEGSRFDTVTVTGIDAKSVHLAALRRNIVMRHVDETTVAFSCDETTDARMIVDIVGSLGVETKVDDVSERTMMLGVVDSMLRSDDFLSQAVFRRHRTETEMLRYLRRLADKDLALDRTMIPLGSCTMKLNATTEMIPVTWPEFANIHPHQPVEDLKGYRRLVHDVEQMMCAVTGYDAVSLQPNAGSQGEFAGLLAIRAYHESRGDHQRTICLIPSSAHGTNAASAVMAGMDVVVVACDDDGNVDLADMRLKCEKAGNRLAALMITYPSTHGVFETAVGEICNIVHDHGGQVYVDGANLNALVGVAKPGLFGADVSHLNLHKTFCIPHGGGGPGVGPVAVRHHLSAFLPGDPLDARHVVGEGGAAVGPVSSAVFGSAGILPISWVYVRMMGPHGLRRATVQAIASANYVSHRLRDHFPTLYTGSAGLVAHECILDLRDITKRTGVSVDDVAKRLMDYGFHAPTMSFPVGGTLMVEPTESESLAELDRFCEAMIAIRGEIARVEAGEWSAEASPLRHAPHTVQDVTGEWNRQYDRSLALFPLPSLRGRGYFPPVSRIDAAHGDRNLVCSCEPLEALASTN
ncbi:MAG: aminomethyl-transferring glycine dehydrogenase [Ilumatobacteraceae bacterium]